MIISIIFICKQHYCFVKLLPFNIYFNTFSKDRGLGGFGTNDSLAEADAIEEETVHSGSSFTTIVLTIEVLTIEALLEST